MKTVLGVALGLLGGVLLNVDIGALLVAVGGPWTSGDTPFPERELAPEQVLVNRFT